MADKHKYDKKKHKRLLEIRNKFGLFYTEEVGDPTEFIEWLLRFFGFTELDREGDGRRWLADNETLKEWEIEGRDKLRERRRERR